MESRNSSEDSLSITNVKSSFPVVDEGTYDATYAGFQVFMDNTPWGEKKVARVYFQIVRGKFKGGKVSFKGTFMKDPETDGWVVGSKSKLADVIRIITGGSGNLTAEDKGTGVFVNVQQKVAKKSGNAYCFVENVLEKPKDDEEEVEVPKRVAVQAAPQPAVQQPVVQQPAVQQEVQPVAAQPAPAVEKKAEGGLLDDLDSLSDFRE